MVALPFGQMPHRIVVIHERPGIARTLTRAFEERGFSSTAVATVDEALDYLCAGGDASVILYDGARSDTGWLFARAQDANPALSRIPLIALSPLNGGLSRGSTAVDGAASIDLKALILIVGQLCRAHVSAPREMSRDT